MGKPEIQKNRKQKLALWCTFLIGYSKYDQKCMKLYQKHCNITQNMHGASKNYRYVWDVSTPTSLPHVGLNPLEEGLRRLGGVGPSIGAWTKREAHLPLMGP